MDIFLSEKLTGIDVGKELSQRKKDFLFLTANQDERTLREAATLSPKTYLTKPFQKRLAWSRVNFHKYMRFTQQEKYEIIRIVEDSELGVNRTLKELGISKRTFYNWYGKYKEQGYDGLAPRNRSARTQWNRIPDQIREEVVEYALERPELSPRELAHSIVDHKEYFISESSVYRILKSRGLITSPAYIVMKASSEFKDKTTRPNQMWQTDFTYFKIIGWGLVLSVDSIG